MTEPPGADAGPPVGRPATSHGGSWATMPVPSLILAADHRARGVMTVERYADYVTALEVALPHCDGILASAQPLGDLATSGALTPRHRTYLSLNRTGLAGSVFELDDRLVATVERAAADGWTGVKHMTRIDRSDPAGAGALELLGQVLESARAAGLDALVESVVWRDGTMARDPDSVVFAAVVAHDMGAPVLKVPVPDVPAGEPRTSAVARVVASVGVPVLFLGGPRRGTQDGRRSEEDARQVVLGEVRDVMAGGGAGMAIGRTLYQDPDPAGMAQRMAAAVHGAVGAGVQRR
jgi:DhnA family fructose-bisphosphate aldolase class Ia